MSRIDAHFKDCQDKHRTSLVTYITTGDPSTALTVKLMHEMVKAGADMLELGMPFSDPMADGPTIQLANDRALANGVTMKDTLNCVSLFRTTDPDTPVILMGYLNPIEAMGYETFAEQAKEAGVDGCIIVDCPIEASEALSNTLSNAGLQQIFLLAPTSDEYRIKRANALGSGFLYYVSLNGVTGAASLDAEDVAKKVAAIKAHTNLPTAVGFGIKDAESAANVAQIADAVVVGSAIVKIIEDHQNQPEQMIQKISALVAEMRQAMDAHIA